MLNFPREISNIGPDTVAMIGNFKIANSTLMILFIAILLLVVYFVWVRKFTRRPGTAQSFMEVLVESIASFVDQITGSRKISEPILPIITTLFVFLGISNLIGLIPGLTSIMIGDVPLFRSPTADFNLTFALALGAVIAIQFASVKKFGIWEHINKFIKVKAIYQGFKKSLKDGFMSLVDFAIGILDIIGEFAKVVSLSLRLFGNIYAGEVLSVILIGALAYVVPAAWTAMNVLVGVIQALVFGSLVTAYYTLAMSDEG